MKPLMIFSPPCQRLIAKTIRRERREAQAGIDIEALTGADLTEAPLGRLLRSTWIPDHANGAGPI